MKKIAALYILLCLSLLTIQAGYVIVGYGNPQSAEATINFPAGTITDISVTTLHNPFSVAADRKVLFTAGNLQYQASSGNWRIAESQYTMIGYNPGNTNFVNTGVGGRNTQEAWIDMLPFGCSGWNSGVTNYQPWYYGVNGNNCLYKNLTDSYVEADWAWHNEIYCPHKDANIPNHTIRVLTNDEWVYLLKTRTNANKLYAQARIKISDAPEYVNGLVILPDMFSSTYSTLKIHGNTSWSITRSSYADNEFTIDQWNDFEEATGAVFLPASGAYEHDQSDGGKYGAKHEPGKYGLYWSTTFNNGNKAKYMGFKPAGYANDLSSPFDGVRRVDNRLAVRAVIDYNYPSYSCTNCKNVTFGAPEAPSTEWTITVNPGGNRVFDEDITWDDDASIQSLTRSFDRTDPSSTASFHVDFLTKKAIYVSEDDLLPKYTEDAQERGTVELEDRIDWPKQLTATPADGFVFLRWDDGNVSNPRTISSIEEAAIKGYYTAYFAPEATSGRYLVDANVDEWFADSVSFATAANDLEDVVYGTEITFNGTGTAIKGVKTDVDNGIYKAYAGVLADHAGETMQIVWLDRCGNVVSHKQNIAIPTIVNGSTNSSAMSLSGTSDVVVPPGMTLTFDEDCTIASLSILPGAKAIINNNVTLTTGSLTMRADGIAGDEGIYPQLLVNGSILKKSDTSNPLPLNLDYTLDYHKYYPLMLPYNVNIADITFLDGSPAVIDEDYEIHRYNGASRAEGRGGWENVGSDSPATTTLSAAQGYDIFAAQEWNTTYRRAVLRFPMLADLSEGETAKALPVSLYPAATPNNANWNLIGNPYLSSFHELDEDADAIELIAEVDDNKTGEKVRYITIPENGFRNYNQVLVEDAAVSPFNVFFIQAADEADLTIAVGDRYLKAPARQTAETSDMPKELTAGITLTQGSRSDKTGILLGNAFTEEYDYNADLAKMFGTADRLNVYSVVGNTQLAYCALPYAIDGNGQVLPNTLSIGYRNASTEDDATFAFDSKRYKSNALEVLYLTDNYTGQTVDLLLEDYTFSPLKAQDDERFTLSAQPRRVLDVTTGLDATLSAATGHASGVYDLLGRKICDSADNFKRMKSSIPAGVYIVIDNGQLTKEIIR